MKKKKEDKLQMEMQRELIRKVLFEGIVFAIIVIGVYLISIPVFRHKTWTDEPVYLFLKFFKTNYFGIACLLFSFRVISNVVGQWRRTIKYLRAVVVSASEIVLAPGDTTDVFIELPDELQDIQNSLNHMKMKYIENEHIAKEAEQRKNDLIVYLAHDLKTPLCSIMGYLTLLEEEPQISEELRQRYIAVLLRKAGRLEDLINEFFEVTRFKLSNIELQTGKINVTRVLEQIIYDFGPLLKERNVNCVLEARDGIEIICDADKMQRVFENILRNAVNYCYENSSIWVKVEEEERNIQVSFKNNGSTIPKEKLERIFEQFYRLDKSRETQNGGSGLGLAIAKQIVQLHQGQITAHSENEEVIIQVLLPK